MSETIPTGRVSATVENRRVRHIEDSRRRSRGFVLLLALSLMAVVIAAAADLSLAVGSQYQRTRTAVVDAQLRQLLMAGCEAARQQIVDGRAATTAVTVALPDELASNGGVLTVTALAGNTEDDAAMTIEARFGGHRESELIRFHRAGAGWVLADVALDQ